MVSILRFYGFPFIAAVIISKMVIGSIAIECRSKNFSIWVQFLYSFSHFYGFITKFLYSYRIRMHTAMSVMPQSRFIIKAVTLNTCWRCGISKFVYDIIYILIHINHTVCEVRSICKSAAFCQYNFIPAVRRSSLCFRNRTIFISRNISCKL